MPPWRRTAIVQFELPSGATESSLPLAVEREFGVILVIEGRAWPAQTFHSPINDEQWREFIRQLRDCNANRDPQTGNRGAAAIRTLARNLYHALIQLSPALREFLEASGVPRRLVIQTTRPELHLLPWAAMYDDSGHLLAAGDLSVVQCWKDFSSVPVATGSQITLLKVLGQDTNQRTAKALDTLKPTPEIVQQDVTNAFEAGRAIGDGDIVHIEKHGDAVDNTTGGMAAVTLGSRFAQVKMALLWSCYSSAANSWGESAALDLHQSGAGLVLSFLAELHNEDASSISKAFYSDVFGPAASRDPESALVRVRCAKAVTEFAFANWASMTVYLRNPIDLSALPLNGPRVPARGWLADTTPTAAAPASPSPAPADDASASFWTRVAAQVSQLQPGTRQWIDAAAVSYDKLPASAFRAWRGNVIRIDEAADAMPDDAVLNELNLPRESAPAADPADRLAWFFAQIARFGSPLIVWTNAAPRHLEFLKTLQPSATLTFLLLYGPRRDKPSLMELVDENRLDEALQACDSLPADCGDEQLYAAYYACVRGEKAERALPLLFRVASPQERLLLMGNYVSRKPKTPLSNDLLQSVGLSAQADPLRPEDFYRLAMSSSDGKPSQRECGRAKLQLAYIMHSRGQTETAELLLRLALADIEASGQDAATRRDSRWYFALSATLRDWADLVADAPDRLDEASRLLHRATTIQALHGMRLELAYSTMTAARIALAACRYTKAIDNAVDAANRFEDCNNWRGWYSALRILFDSLAETRETARMLSLANLANEKLQLSNLTEDARESNRQDLAFQRARAHWIAGDLAQAREELNALRESASANHKKQPDPKLERLYAFLRLSPVIRADQN